MRRKGLTLIFLFGWSAFFPHKKMVRHGRGKPNFFLSLSLSPFSPFPLLLRFSLFPFLLCLIYIFFSSPHRAGPRKRRSSVCSEARKTSGLSVSEEWEERLCCDCVCSNFRFFFIFFFSRCPPSSFYFIFYPLPSHSRLSHYIDTSRMR